MKLRCLFLRHRPMLSSIIVREERFTALCDHCGAPIERDKLRRWVNAASLISSQDEAA
jgi:RNA polymerase-binding transcription factor DksA